MPTTFPELHDDDIRLRALDQCDAEGFGRLLSEPGTHPFIIEDGPLPADRIPERIARKRADFEAGKAIFWAIEVAGRFVGFVAMHAPRKPRPALSYAILPEERRKGYAGRAVRAVLRYAFGRPGIVEVRARTHLDNAASAALLLAIGFEARGPAETEYGPRLEFAATRPGDAVEVRLDDLSGPEIAALLGEHLASMHENSPEGGVHALDLSGLRAPDVTFWTLWQKGELLGCGALKEIGAEHGEIKSMRTAEAHLRKGVATAVLEHLMSVARERGYRRVSLETGSGAAFEPAQALYERFGFERCGPFADYGDNGFSVFMTREL